MTKTRIPAFTIMELTVAMLISAIVIGITYTAFNMISQSYNAYTLKHNELAVLLRLNDRLEKDFLRAEAIFNEPDGIRLNIQQHPIHYRFEAQQVIRISTITDTFKVLTSNLTTLQEQKEITANFEHTNQLPLIDEMLFSVGLNAEKIPYHYYKRYSSAQLINSNINAND